MILVPDTLPISPVADYSVAILSLGLVEFTGMLATFTLNTHASRYLCPRFDMEKNMHLYFQSSNYYSETHKKDPGQLGLLNVFGFISAGCSFN